MIRMLPSPFGLPNFTLLFRFLKIEDDDQSFMLRFLLSSHVALVRKESVYFLFTLLSCGMQQMF